MIDVKERFTKWYIRNGYRFYYRFDPAKTLYTNDVFKFTDSVPEARFLCPWYIRPLLIFFSPSVYMYEEYGKQIAKSFMKGMEEAERGKEKDT